MARGPASLGVDWYLPGQRRRFTSTTPASSVLIEVMAGHGLTWSEVHDGIHHDADAKAVAARFVAEGHGDVEVRTMVVAR